MNQSPSRNSYLPFKSTKVGLFYVALILAALLWFTPVITLVLTALKDAGDFAVNGAFSLPKSIRWSNFSEAWETGVKNYFWNSVIVTSFKVPIGIILESLAAFALTHMHFKWADRIFRGRDIHYWMPPAQIPAGVIHAPGSHLGWLTTKPTKQLPVHSRASGTHLPGAVSGTCVALPCSPRSSPLAPPAPPPVAQVLFAGFSATMKRSDFSCPCVIGFDSSSSRRGPLPYPWGGQAGDLPVPVQGAYLHARV